jgi:hypothetical protein
MAVYANRLAGVTSDGGFVVNLEPLSAGADEARAYFDQVVEFAGPKPTIHFVILTADGDPTQATTAVS